jgi:acetyltransferase-like isoleucine patch superfamily enzyme
MPGIRPIYRLICRSSAYHIDGILLGLIKAKLSAAEKFGKHPIIVGRICFQLDGKAIIGDRFRANGQVAKVHVSVAEAGTLSIGDDVYMGPGVSVIAMRDVRIGNNVLFAPCSSVVDDNWHEVEPGAPRYKGPVIIGNNVWIGRNTTVMPGAVIGDGSVIGANSVVTKEIPPSSFAAGSPATVIRKLELPDGWIRR